MGWKGTTPKMYGALLVKAVKDNHERADKLVFATIERRSPVLSGAFKADWGQHIQRSKLLTVFANHLPYAMKLEYGASNINAPYSRAFPKAPYGIARVTTIEMAPKIQALGLLIK